ncbi:hypothetical protein GGR56DRAFT_673337 [Xylariaceae sp. FL0804]|nr:hypothetical protein GGR56DRAFT_673337 [Xylariaceae sp. FL0804]
MTSVVIVGGQKGYDGDGLTQYTKETTEANGVVVTEMPQAFALISTSIGRNAEGVPTSTYLIEVLNSPMETVLTNAQGQATATLDYYLVSGRTETARTATLRNAEGVATATTTFLVPVTSQTTVYMPAPTSAQPTAPTDEETLRVVGISHGRSFAGLVLPVLLAIAVSIPVRILDQNVKLYAGFHALVSSPGGATASQSLCLETTGFGGLLSSAQSLVGGGHYMLTLTGSLVVLSALAIPFSAEVFRVVLHGEDCQHLATTTTTTTATGLTCSLTIGVSPIPAKVMLALLTAMLVGAAAAAAILRRWHIGVSENPWSIFYMAGLAVDPSVKSILSRLRPRGQGIMGHHADIISNQRIRRADILKALGDKTFVLSEWTDREGRPRYGVRIADPVGQPLNNNNTKAGRNNKQVSFEEPDKAVDNDRLFPHCENMPFFILTWLGRILFLLLLGAVMIAVLTYNIAVSGSEHGQRLADRAVGVRFLFTGAGVLVSLVWGSFFYAVSFASPHALLHSRRPNGSHGLYTSPPTHALAGLRYALGRMHRSAYLGAVAAAAVLAELLLPLLLSSIVPVQHEQQLAVAVWCTWASVALLGGMMLAVAASFVVDWPRLPLDPSTILGAMWYGNYHLVSRSASPGDLFPRHVRRTMPV